MTAVVVGKEKLVAAHGLGVGDAARLVVDAAEERGYSVAATGPGQFRMIRQTRPVWATVAAIVGFPFLGLGLLFLLVKKTDEGSVAVFEERDGTKVRLVGSIDEEVAAAVGDGRSAAATGGVASRRVVASSPPTAASASGDSKPVEGTPPRLGSEPLIDSTPWAKGTAVPADSSDDDIGRTVARPRTKTIGAALGLHFPDGRVVPLASGVVVGRSPSAPEGKSQAVPVACQDSEMSKTHLLVELSGTAILVTDLHSTNGTAVANNGDLVTCRPGEKVPVEAASTIHAGSSQISIAELP